MSKIRRNITQFTYDIEEAIGYIQNDLLDKSFEEFSSDVKTISFVERQLEKIGEAITQIQKLDKEILYKVYNNKSYWEDIKGMRNRLIHEYWGTSIDMLYNVSMLELDELKEYIKEIRKIYEFTL